MKRLDAYAQPAGSWTRIEMLLAAFDGTISRLEEASDFLKRGDKSKSDLLLLRSQRIVLELYSGVDARYGQIPENMSKLYLFVLGCIGLGLKLDIKAAIDVLQIIRSGLNDIRDSASQMERRGELSPARTQSQVLQHIVA